MPTVLIQIGLSDGRPRDYANLAEFMGRSGWRGKLAGADGQEHPLAPGTYVGSHDDPTKLATELRTDIQNSGLDSSPIVLAAILQSWVIAG